MIGNNLKNQEEIIMNDTGVGGNMSEGNVILIVDDEEVFCKILERRLKTFGYEPIWATSAQAGLELAREKGPDVFVLDWMMPEMDGLEMTKAIREDPALRAGYVIILTAKSGTTETAAALEAGADEFLTKPIDDEELRARVRAGFRIASLYKDLEEKNKNLEDVNELIKKKNLQLDASSKRLAEDHKKLQRYTETLKDEKEGLEKLLMIAPTVETEGHSESDISIPTGKIYLIDEERPTLGFRYFSSLIHHSKPGLGISRRHPDDIRRQYHMEKTPLVWLTQKKGDDEMVLLPDTTKFSSVVTSFLSKTENGVVIIEGLEYLISQTDFDAVLKLVQFLNDKIMGTTNMIIITMDLEILEDKQAKFFKKEMTDIEAISSEMMMDSIDIDGINRV